MRISDWSSDVCSSDLQGGSCHRFCRIYRISVVSVRLSPSLSFQLSVNLSPFLPPLNLNARYGSRETAGPHWASSTNLPLHLAWTISVKWAGTIFPFLSFLWPVYLMRSEEVRGGKKV